METDKIGKYKISETYIKLNIEYDSDKKEKIVRTLRSTTEKIVSDYKYNDGLVLVIELEKGSLKVKIAVYGTIIIQLIAEYETIRQGLTQVCNDVKWISERVIENARANSYEIDRNIIRTEKRTGLIGRLKRTIDKIENLQRSLTDQSNRQTLIGLNSLKQDLSNIIELLSEQERQAILNSLNDDVKNNLPRPEEKGMQHIYNLYALKPEETTVESERH